MQKEIDHVGPGSAPDAPENNVFRAPAHSEEHRSHLRALGLELDEDGVVRWERSNELHPRNWSLGRKLYDISLVVTLDFATYVHFAPSITFPCGFMSIADDMKNCN
jgi:hypothetical protein